MSNGTEILNQNFTVGITAETKRTPNGHLPDSHIVQSLEKLERRLERITRLTESLPERLNGFNEDDPEQSGQLMIKAIKTGRLIEKS